MGRKTVTIPKAVQKKAKDGARTGEETTTVFDGDGKRWMASSPAPLC